MNIQELRAQLVQLSPEEREQVASFLAALSLLQGAELKRELAQRNHDMDAGHGISEQEIARILAH